MGLSQHCTTFNVSDTLGEFMGKHGNLTEGIDQMGLGDHWSLFLVTHDDGGVLKRRRVLRSLTLRGTR